jgi:hypothetical protein
MGILAAALLAARAVHAEALPVPAVVDSPRTARLFAASFAAGVFAGPVGIAPHVGVTLGVNLGRYLMVDLAAGGPHALGGIKVLFGRGEITGYAAARAGLFLFSERPPLLLASLGLDVSRPEGTYAFIEVGPVIYHRRANSYEATPSEWLFGAVQVAYGIGKRF